MATLTIEDLTGQAAVTVFPGAFSQFAHLIAKDRLVIVKGHVQHRDIAADGTKRIEIITRSIEQLDASESASEDHSTSLSGTIRVQVLKATYAQLQRVKALVESNPGDFELTLEIGSNGSSKMYETRYRVNDGPWVAELRRTLEQGFVRVQRRTNPFAKHMEPAPA
jgi:DNA polymerase III alpha subunit